MAKSLYVSVEDVCNRMQLDPKLSGMHTSVESAINGAQTHIEALLVSKLDLTDWDVRFSLDSESFSGIQVGERYRLELPSGFVRQSPAPVVTAADNWRMEGAITVPTTDYEIDYVRGYVLIDAENYHDYYVRVTCRTGFTPNAPETQADEQDQLPDWLNEAILSYVPVIFDVSQTTNRNPEAQAAYTRSGDHALAALAPYLRSKGFAFRPI